MKIRIHKLLQAATLASLVLLTAGCSHIRYYHQSMTGHLKIMTATQPLEELIAAAKTTSHLKRQLALIKKTVVFAREELFLSTANSYSEYADINREYVVWNIFAAPALSLDAKQWCFLIAGCLAYKGFFSEAQAKQYKTLLQQQGYDVYLGGVVAYSTLGWFNDPVLNTMLNRSDRALVKLIIHELMHQNIYLKDDTSLNEAIAEAMAIIALSRWQISAPEIYRALEQNSDDFEEKVIRLILNKRDNLDTLYNSDLSKKIKLEKKEGIFQQLQSEYATLKKNYPGNRGFDRWFYQDLNNAKIASVSTYRKLVPDLLSIYQKLNHDLKAFYTFLTQLKRCHADKRQQLISRHTHEFAC